ncbi:MAG: hypothetical protein JOZ63_01165 [Planctomycetaceae bacterium]|nr:hypothetical protein [Planctomycetaceae bacterium]
MSHKNEQPSLHPCECLTCQQRRDSPIAEVHRALNQFLATADERSRRLLAGSLALQHGRGGIALAARITGLSPHTIRRGRHELQQATPTPRGRIRRPGAGRKPVEKKVPRS